MSDAVRSRPGDHPAAFGFPRSTCDTAVGFGAKPLIFTRQLLSDRAYDVLIRRASGLR